MKLLQLTIASILSISPITNSHAKDYIDGYNDGLLAGSESASCPPADIENAYNNLIESL